VKISEIFSRYPIYVLVGIGLTLCTIAIRSVIGVVIEDDSTPGYIASIILAYGIGMLLSLVAHTNITFKAKTRLSPHQVFQFVSINVIGMLLNILGAIVLREKLLAAALPIELAKVLAFATAALLVSVMTYLLKKYIIFD
jgi:putative flippase GtrA